MSTPTIRQADPNRKLYDLDWYEQNEPAGTKFSWALHLCVEPKIVEEFLPQVRAALHEAVLAKRPVTRDAPWTSHRLVAEQLSRMRPDLACKGLPFDAFANVVRAIAFKMNSSTSSPERSEPPETANTEKTRKRKADDKLNGCKRPEKQARLLSREDLRERAESSTRTDTERENNVDEKIAAMRQNVRNLTEQLDDRNAPSVLEQPTGVYAQRDAFLEPQDTPSTKPTFNFDPDLATLSIIDVAHPRDTQILPLISFGGLTQSNDTQTPNFVKLNAVQKALGPEKYNSSREDLWCKIDGIYHLVKDQDSFSILCRWQVEDATAKYPHIPPRIRFEKHAIPMDAAIHHRSPIPENADRPEITVETAPTDLAESIQQKIFLSSSSSETTSSSGSSSTSGSRSPIKYVEETKGDLTSNGANSDPKQAELPIQSGGQLSDSDSDSDRPLLQIRKHGITDTTQYSKVDSDDSSEDSSSSMSAIVVLSKPLSQRRLSQSEQLLETFQRPALPTPSIETQEAARNTTKKEKHKKRRG